MRLVFTMIRQRTAARFWCAMALLAAICAAPGAAYAQTVLVVGDSLSAAYGLLEQEGWVRLAENQLQQTHPDLTIVNASISGDTTDGGLRRLPDALERHKPDVLVIELGGNDGLRGQTLKPMRENLTQMATLGQQAGAQVLILGMQIPTNYGPAYTRRFAQVFERVAEETGSALVPFFLEPIATDRSMFQQDGIHPTAEAQPMLVEHVIADIEALLDKVAN